jgi:hypothetical protein
MTFEYDGLLFRGVSNTDNGEVSGDTLFHYHQRGDLVWGTYEGGQILFGTLVAQVQEEGVLDMRYQHLNRDRVFATGVCRSVPERLPDGRLRLHETWRWTSGDLSSGRSVVEEVRGAPGRGLEAR